VKKHLLTIAVALVATSALFAQTSQTSFLLENYVYGYRFNPAYTPEKNFIGIPVLGNINPSIKSQIGISTLLFPTDNGLVTGLNSAVSSDQFLKGIKTRNVATVDLNENIIAFGFRHKKGGYSNVELNWRTNVSLSLPYEMFAFLKDNGSPSYDLSNLYGGGNSYVELAYGYSRKLSDKLNFGARVKFLVGIADLRLDVYEAGVSTSNSKILASADAYLYGACGFLSYETKASEYEAGSNDVIDFDSIGFNGGKYAPSGYGAAVDFGVMYQPVDGLELNFSINDLGGLMWKYNVVGKTNANAVYEGQRIQPGQSGQESEVESELNAALETLKSLAEFHDAGSASKFKMIPFSANAGLKYRMPFYRNLSVGGMATYKYSTIGASWYDARGGAAINPAEWFSFTANAGYSSFGPVCGAAFSISFVGINIFASMDGYIGRIATGKTQNGLSIAYPVNQFGYSMNFGINVLFGQRVRAF